jgi:hypothetical protein
MNPSDYRRHDLLYTQERLSLYRPGGHHPVCLGDTFKDGRYKIIHKLGRGESSIVWLAKDKECVHRTIFFFDLSDVQKAQSMGFVENSSGRILTGFSRDHQFATIGKAFSRTILKIYCSITRLLYSPRT